jgi:mevalonate kinase
VKVIATKNIFSQMEAFFRKSSGLDPLNSYLSIPILINSKIILKLQVFQIKLWTERRCVFVRFRNVGETAPMVTIFMENLKDKGFMLKNQFVKYTDACGKFLGGDMKALFMNTKKLSSVVLNNFKPMIPEQFHAIWQNGIDTNDYYLKLCGSGGGYILGFTEDLER